MAYRKALPETERILEYLRHSQARLNFANGKARILYLDRTHPPIEVELEAAWKLIHEGRVTQGGQPTGIVPETRRA